MGDFLLISIVASVVLTIVLNVVLRFWKPDPERWFPSEPGSRQQGPPPIDIGHFGHGAGNDYGDGHRHGDRFKGPRVRVFVPWKAMLAVSIGLTVVLNVVALLAR